jgi:hypothetical protein
MSTTYNPKTDRFCKQSNKTISDAALPCHTQPKGPGLHTTTDLFPNNEHSQVLLYRLLWLSAAPETITSCYTYFDANATSCLKVKSEKLIFFPAGTALT